MVKYFSMVVKIEVEKTKREIYNLKAKLDCLEVMGRLEQKGVHVKIDNGKIYLSQNLHRKEGSVFQSFETFERKTWVNRTLFLDRILKDIEAGHIQVEAVEE